MALLYEYADILKGQNIERDFSERKKMSIVLHCDHQSMILKLKIENYLIVKI